VKLRRFRIEIRPLNDRVVLNANTSDLIWSIQEIVSHYAIGSRLNRVISYQQVRQLAWIRWAILLLHTELI